MKKISLFIVILSLLGISAVAQGDFISVKEVASKINNPKCIIIDARIATDYKKVHIRNAISLPIADLSVKTPVEGVLKSDAEIGKILGAHGIDLNKEIILYCNKGHSAGRMYWVFKMMGANNVKMLDGNLDAWKAKRKPVTKNPKKVAATKLSAKLNRSTLVSQADVKAKKGKPGVVLVDARDDKYFKGLDPKSKGHIAGAISVSSDLMRDAKGLVKSQDELSKLFSSKGITKDKEVILYCQTSTRAGLLYAILTSRLGYNNVKVYDGAYNDWVAGGNEIVK
jgi:thiosulfate/3-mercaptopyruvate sulfurtransferase